MRGEILAKMPDYSKPEAVLREKSRDSGAAADNNMVGKGMNTLNIG